MSNESCCPRPPLSRITITDRARPVWPAAAAAAPLGREQTRQPHAQQPGVAHLEETASRGPREGRVFRFEIPHPGQPPQVSTSLARIAPDGAIA